MEKYKLNHQANVVEAVERVVKRKNLLMV